MARVNIGDTVNNVPNDGEVMFTVKVSNINPKNEKRAEAMLMQVDNMLSDGKVDMMEGFQLLGLLVALGKL